jgi:hypothetical protein
MTGSIAILNHIGDLRLVLRPLAAHSGVAVLAVFPAKNSGGFGRSPRNPLSFGNRSSRRTAKFLAVIRC